MPIGLSIAGLPELRASTVLHFFLSLSLGIRTVDEWEQVMFVHARVRKCVSVHATRTHSETGQEGKERQKASLS